MSGQDPAEGDRHGTDRLAMRTMPNAERYVLEADAMRRRQLRSALLHGSRRTWREHARVWPAVVVGLVVAAVIVAALAVTQALQKTQENEKKEQQQPQQPSPTAPASPGAGPSTSPRPTPTGSP
ncbi:hypothetical protein AB3X52_13310 [Nocardioides sp. DS6]|uniref:DUF3040 domain-containing protein n=1 Tax=Nocardioides eburneus TaxID=3231482 RepID=A0ABV3T080_9ACTN